MQVDLFQPIFDQPIYKLALTYTFGFDVYLLLPTIKVEISIVDLSAVRILIRMRKVIIKLPSSDLAKVSRVGVG